MRTRAQARVDASPLQALQAEPRRKRRAPARKKKAAEPEPQHEPAPIPEPTPTPKPLPDSNLHGEDLLDHILAHKAKDEQQRAEAHERRLAAAAADAAADAADEELESTTPARPTTAPPALPKTPEVAYSRAPGMEPPSTGWGIRSLFNAIPTFFSTAAATFTSSPTRQEPGQQGQESQQRPQESVTLPQEQVNQIGLALTPTPAIRPVRPFRSVQRPRASASASKPKKSRRERNIIKTAVRDVDPEQEQLALSWAETTAQKIVAESATTGDKRRQLAQPMKLKDVKSIPARRPWESTGSFGLLPEFFDDSDSDEEAQAPGWYVVDQLANEQPALKKRKTGESQTTPRDERFFNSEGRTTSPYDLHPRSAIVPSPMFNNPVVHHEDGNIFLEAEQYAATEQHTRLGFSSKEAYEKELRRTGHIEGSGSFCVPEPDSDEETDVDGSPNNQPPPNNQSSPWTQEPPPAPMPAHASLPGLDTPQRKSDPVGFQRAKAMKFTPAKPSRLREAMVPSPSTVAGSPALKPTAAAVSQPVQGDDGKYRYMYRASEFPTPLQGAPDYTPLTSEDDAILDAAQSLVDDYWRKPEHSAYGGSDYLAVWNRPSDADVEDPLEFNFSILNWKPSEKSDLGVVVEFGA